MSPQAGAIDGSVVARLLWGGQQTATVGGAGGRSRASAVQASRVSSSGAPVPPVHVGTRRVLAGVPGGVAGGAASGVEPGVLAQPQGARDDEAARGCVARGGREDDCNARVGSRIWPFDDRGPGRSRAVRRGGGRGSGDARGDEP